MERGGKIFVKRKNKQGVRFSTNTAFKVGTKQAGNREITEYNVYTDTKEDRRVKTSGGTDKGNYVSVSGKTFDEIKSKVKLDVTAKKIKSERLNANKYGSPAAISTSVATKNYLNPQKR